MVASVLSEFWQSPISSSPIIEGTNVWLLDHSTHQRLGLKGKGAAAWLSNQGLAVPEQSNKATKQSDLLVARLAPREILMLSDAAKPTALIDQVIANLIEVEPADCYPLPRQDMSACFRLEGSKAQAVLADYCAIDLRPKNFADGQVAQTSLASINAIIIRNDREGQAGFDLVMDFASAAYLWKILVNRVMPGKVSLEN